MSLTYSIDWDDDLNAWKLRDYVEIVGANGKELCMSECLNQCLEAVSNAIPGNATAEKDPAAVSHALDEWLWKQGWLITVLNSRSVTKMQFCTAVLQQFEKLRSVRQYTTSLSGITLGVIQSNQRNQWISDILIEGDMSFDDIKAKVEATARIWLAQNRVRRGGTFFITFQAIPAPFTKQSMDAALYHHGWEWLEVFFCVEEKAV